MIRAIKKDQLINRTAPLGLLMILIVLGTIAAVPVRNGGGFGFLDGGGFPTATPTVTPTFTPVPTATNTPLSLESLFPTETPTPEIPYPLQGFFEDTEGAQAMGIEPAESQPRSPSLWLLSLPFAAAALILAVIVLNWMRRSRG